MDGKAEQELKGMEGNSCIIETSVALCKIWNNVAVVYIE
jgi:hypothetical protein